MEYEPSILERVRNVYRVYRIVPGMSTEYTGMCLEYLLSILELCRICSKYTGMRLEYTPSILELDWYVYRVHGNVLGKPPVYTGNCLECITSKLECVWNITRVYWNLSGMSTKYTGMSLEYLPGILELCRLCSEYT